MFLSTYLSLTAVYRTVFLVSQFPFEMDTSDSECFESADEEFDYDYGKNDLRIKQTQSHKIIEPELCKLKLEEHEESGDPNSCIAKLADNNIFPSQNVIASPINNKSLCDNKTKTIIDIKTTNTKQLKMKPKVEHKHTNNAESTTDFLELSEENIQNSHVLKVEGNSKSESNVDVLKINKEDNLESSVVVRDNDANKENEKQEDNLWNDDEIDWGSDTIKEELQKITDSSQSNNEDSGWDDFDVDWETSIQSTQSPNTGVNAAKIENIRKPSLSDDYGDWESLEKPDEKQKSSKDDLSWGGWGSWGVSSILNTATQSVSTLTNHVSQGLSAVLEGGMGIPDPEDLAKMNISNKEKSEELNNEIENGGPSTPVTFGLGNLVSGVSHLTKFVESTGTKVIAGSLDTLEAIGKKTVEVLQDGDPGLKKKRAFLKLEAGKPNLSQILREAKEKAEEEGLEQKNINTKKIKNYEALFDDHQGLVHLEALEMLSKVCSIKLDNLNNTLAADALKEIQETLEQVKELCELPDDDEDNEISLTDAKNTIENAVKEINIPISYNKLFASCEETDNWLDNINTTFIDDLDLHQQAIETLAQLTAMAVEQFHKTGELLMVKDHRSTADEADSLVQITITLKAIILNQASKFTQKFNLIELADKETVNEKITNIFYEAANSGTYIQTAFQLLIPVLQVGAI